MTGPQRSGASVFEVWLAYCYDCGRTLGTFAHNQYQEGVDAVGEHKRLQPINGGCHGFIVVFGGVTPPSGPSVEPTTLPSGHSSNANPPPHRPLLGGRPTPIQALEPGAAPLGGVEVPQSPESTR